MKAEGERGIGVIWPVRLHRRHLRRYSPLRLQFRFVRKESLLLAVRELRTDVSLRQTVLQRKKKP